MVVLYLSKSTTVFENRSNFTENGEFDSEGLSYDSDVLENLVTRDTDGDGILDWEEFLWGTDPNKRDTDDDGTPDNIEIENQKKERGVDQQGLPLLTEEEREGLTETDKFSREFFSTIAALSQNGDIDQETVDKLSTSLLGGIQNSPQRKIYISTDIQITTNENVQNIRSYDSALDNIFKEYRVDYSTIDVLAEFINDEDEVNVDALAKLDPIIDRLEIILSEMSEINTPQSLSPLHLDLMNVLEKIKENLEDIKLFEVDVILTLSAISQYEANVANLQTTADTLANKIEEKL